MEPWHLDDQATIYHGDCREVLAELPDASVDSVVTDPPYELGFMGKRWDASGIAYDAGLWAECLRVLKPGGHLLAFGGTRTWHRLAVAIEDAGFEIRDSIAWMYGSGFPKSLDVSKAIDKQRGESEWRPHAKVAAWLVEQMQARGVSRADVSEHFHAANIAQQWTTHWIDGAVKPRVPKWDQWQELKRWLSLPDDMDALVWQLNGRKGQPGQAWQDRPVTGQYEQPDPRLTTWQEMQGKERGTAKERRDIPATPDAARWQGWGTALKPAHEPVVVARKPLTGTVAGNVLWHGTGALNIDGCRIGMSPEDRAVVDVRSGGSGGGRDGFLGDVDRAPGQRFTSAPGGRWPANVVLDEDQAAALDRQSGSAGGGYGVRGSGGRTYANGKGFANTLAEVGQTVGYGDSGGASRFFYVAKAPARERPKVDGIAHPTVKPLTLMRWLCRLVTPPGGVVLEPFAGSGTTIEAALMEGFRVVAIEREPDYLPLIAARLERVTQEPDDGQLTFDASA